MLVYKFINTVNEKSYIGITTKILEERKLLHIRDAMNHNTNSIFHKAIRKYGIKSFKIEVLEDNIEDKEELKEREIFYILKYNTHYIEGYGYNMTHGGDLMNSGEDHPSSKMTNDEVKEIRELLKNTSLTYPDIVKKLNLNVTGNQIYYINNGEQWNDSNTEYPIRKNPKSISKTGENNPAAKLTDEKVLEIIELLKNTRLSQQEIADKYNMHRNMINYINTCKSWKHLHNFKNNIRQESGMSTENRKMRIGDKKTIEIIELLQTNMLQKDISKKTGIGTVTISKINNCKVGKYLHKFKKNIRREWKGGGTGYEKDK